MKAGSGFTYLLVDICPIVDQQLQTEGTVGGDSSQVQGGVAALVGLVNVSAVVDQLGGHCLLAHVARHVERSVSKSVGLVDLTAKTRPHPQRESDADRAASTRRASETTTHLCPHSQKVLHDFDVAARRGGVEGGVALLVLAAFVRAPGHQQLHDVRVPCRRQEGRGYFSGGRGQNRALNRGK